LIQLTYKIQVLTNTIPMTKYQRTYKDLNKYRSNKQDIFYAFLALAVILITSYFTN